MSITQLFETVLKIILIVLGLIVAVPFIIWLDATIHQWLLSSLIQIIPESFTGCVDILVTTPDTSELLAILSIFATVTVMCVYIV